MSTARPYPSKVDRLGPALLALLLVAWAPTSFAKTAPPPSLAFYVPSKALPDALLEIALQARASVGGEISLCKGVSPPLMGRFTLRRALNLTLRNSGCGFVLIDHTTIVIRKPASGARRPGQGEPQAKDLPPSVTELVVTAGRRTDIPGRLPFSVSALSGEALRARRDRDVADLTGEVSGLTTTNLGPGRNKIFLRGVSDGAFTGVTQSTVGLYVDDVPVTYNAPDPDLKLVDIDRVEVIRGPQGTLYGIGSIGGILRIVTNRPNLVAYSGSMVVEGSQTTEGGANSALEVVVNAPVIEGRIALRGSAYKERNSGYIDDVLAGRSHINAVSRDGGRLAFLAKIDENWLVGGGLTHQSLNSRDTQYALANLPRLQRANRVAEPHDNDFDEAFVTANGQGTWGSLALSAAKLIHHFNSRYDASAAATVALGQTTTAAFDDAKAVEIFTGEAVLSSPDQGRLRWLAGGFVSEGETVTETSLQILGTGHLPLYGERRADRVGETALYGELTYDFGRYFSVVAGARLFRFDFDTISNVTQSAALRTFRGRDHASGVSPKVSIRYQPSDHLMVYGQVSQGYRAGGYNTAGATGQLFDGAPFRPDREFEPDELWNYEVGTKLAIWDDSLRLRVAGFYADWKNVQSDQFLRSGFSYAVNVGDATNLGLEVEATWRPNAKLELRAAALADSPELRRGRPIFQSERTGGLPGVPSVSGNISAGYVTPLSHNLKLRLEGRANYVGHSHLSFNAKSQDLMGGYVTGRLSAALEARNWSLTLFADNPADTRGNTFSFGDPFRRSDRYVTPLRPRTVGLRVSADF